MTIDRLPSGSYRIRQMESGITYSLTIDHKPTNAEAVRLISGIISKRPRHGKAPTFETAYEMYIDSKKDILSPATIRGYDVLFRAIPDDFKMMRIHQINSIDLQRLVNGFSASHSAKTSKNFSGLIMSVLRALEVDLPSPHLPQAEKKDVFIPSEEDVRRILEELKNTEFEIPFRLACYGLRRSEIHALSLEDLDGNILTVNKALVRGRDGKWILKKTKTTASSRKVYLDDDLVHLIRSAGKIYDYNPETINKHLWKVQDRLGIQRFSIHKLRHFFASMLHERGFADRMVEDAGGWSARSGVMKTVYIHAMEKEKNRASIASAMTDALRIQ